jgi:hypothetical protein
LEEAFLLLTADNDDGSGPVYGETNGRPDERELQ